MEHTYLVEVVVIAGVEILEDFLAHVELAGAAIGNHVDLAAGGDLTEGAYPSELPRAASQLLVRLFHLDLVVFVHSTTVAEAIVANDLHRTVFAVGRQAVELVLSVCHRLVRVLLLARLLDEVVIAEVGVGALPSMKPMILRHPVHVWISAGQKAVVFWDLELDLHTLAVIAQVRAVAIMLHIAVVYRQLALVVRAM